MFVPTEAPDASHIHPSVAMSRDADALTRVDIGTSALASAGFARTVSETVNASYGYSRLSPSEVLQRLAMGDSITGANRVLHIAWRDVEGVATFVGCCSSTLTTPWTPHGCGHWGLLAVAPEAQGTGVASALVRAAESRLAAAGLRQVQIEYEYTCGDPLAERLHAWYEGSLGFSVSAQPLPTTRGSTQFRRLRKRLPRGEQTVCETGAGATVEAITSRSTTLGCFTRFVRMLRDRFARLQLGQ